MFTNYTNFGLLKSSLPALSVAGAAGRDKKLIKLASSSSEGTEKSKRGNR